MPVLAFEQHQTELNSFWGTFTYKTHAHAIKHKYLRSHKYAQTINCVLKIRKSNRNTHTHAQSSSGSNKISLNNEYSEKKYFYF